MARSMVAWLFTFLAVVMPRGSGMDQVGRIARVLPPDLPLLLVVDDGAALRDGVRRLDLEGGFDALLASFSLDALELDLATPFLDSHGAVAFYCVSVDASGPTIAMLASARFVGGALWAGPDPDAMHSRLDAMSDELVHARQFVRRHEQIGEVDVTVLISITGSAGGVELVKYARVDDVIVISFETGGVKPDESLPWILSRLENGDVHSLGDQSDFQSWRASCAEPGNLFFDANLERASRDRRSFAEHIRRHGELTLSDVIDIDLNDLRRVAAVAHTTGRGMDARVAVDWFGDGVMTRALARMADGEPLELLHRVPSDVSFVQSARVDIAAGQASVREIIRASFPEADDANDALNEDVMRAIGREIAIIGVAVVDEEENVIGTPDEPIGLAVVLAIEDSVAARSLADRALRDLGYHAVVRTREIAGHRVDSLPSMLLGMPPVHFAIEDDVAVVATSLDIVERVLRQIDDPDAPSIQDEPLVRELSQGPSAPAYLFFSAEPGSDARRTATAGGARIRGDGVDFTLRFRCD